MRVSDKMVFGFANERLAARMADFNRQAANISDGKEVRRPSDSPLRFERARATDSQISAFKAMQANAVRVVEETDTADAALAQVQDNLRRAYELSVWGSSEEWQASQRNSAAREVDSLLDSVVALGNSRVGGRYLFGGARDDLVPFQADGTYSGSSVTTQVEVAPGVLVTQRRDGATLFSNPTGTVFAALDALRVALRNNDTTALQATVSRLATSIDAIGEQQTAIGIDSRRTQQAQAAVELMLTQMQPIADNARAVDFAAETSGLAMTQRSLESLQALVPRVLNLGLLKL